MNQTYPQAEDHYKKAQCNFDLVTVLDSSDFQTLSSKPLDWIVTISYYAAIHFLEGYLLEAKPNIRLRTKSQRIGTLDECIKKFELKNSKHGVMGILVKENFRTIKESWKQLYSDADTARYKTYSLDPAIAKISIDNLLIVKVFFLRLSSNFKEKQLANTPPGPLTA